MLCARRVRRPLPAGRKTRSPPPFLRAARILKRIGCGAPSGVLSGVCYKNTAIVIVVADAFVGRPRINPLFNYDEAAHELAGDLFYDSPGTTVEDLRRLLRYIERNSSVESWDDDMTLHFIFPLIQRRGGRDPSE